MVGVVIGPDVRIELDVFLFFCSQRSHKGNVGSTAEMVLFICIEIVGRCQPIFCSCLLRITECRQDHQTTFTCTVALGGEVFIFNSSDKACFFLCVDLSH